MAYKVRTPEKKFFFEGESSSASLFGLQCASGDRRLIITEGELDALAAHQMTGYPAVSVTNAQAAVRDVKRNLQWVESFDRVYICTDMDEVGRDAAQAILTILKPGKGFLVTLPTGYKDPCAMLVDDKTTEFKQAIYSARPIKPPGVADPKDVVEKAISFLQNTNERFGISTGYQVLDDLIGGFRPGELTVLVAGTGVGKTALGRQFALNVSEQGSKVFFIPLEMNPEVVLLQMVEMATGTNLISTKENPEVDTRVLNNIADRVTFFEHFGNLDPDRLCSVVEYACRVGDIKFVVLDHISAVVSGTEDERRGVDAAIAGLKALALRIGVHIVVVSHMSRSTEDKDDNTPTLNKIRHSSGIAQYADLVLGISRPRSSNVTTVETLKISRLWGKYGKFKLNYVNFRFKENENGTDTDDSTGVYDGGVYHADREWEVDNDLPNSDVPGLRAGDADYNNDNEVTKNVSSTDAVTLLALDSSDVCSPSGGNGYIIEEGINLSSAGWSVN